MWGHCGLGKAVYATGWRDENARVRPMGRIISAIRGRTRWPRRSGKSDARVPYLRSTGSPTYPALPRRSNAGLNKGEALNALARTLFFHRHGEIRDRIVEDQSYGACGLNLAVAAVILWNTIYLGRAVTELRSQGEAVPDECLAHIAPLAGSTLPSMAITSGRLPRPKTASGP